MRQGRFLSVSAQYLYWINIDYWRLETGTSFFVFRFEIVQFGQWIFIHDKEKIQALSTHLQARLKMYIMNRSFQFKALLTLNAIPIGFFIIFFFRFAVFYYISTDDIRMQFIDAVEIIYFFYSFHSIKRQTTIHIFRPKYFI